VASLGTSPPSPPEPALTDEASGTIEVTADQPVATLDISVTASAELRSAPTNFTEVAIRPTNNGADLATAKTIATIESLDGDHASKTDAFPFLTTSLDQACGPGACTGHFRITVVLMDPETDRATFDWAARASSRFGPGGGTGSPPPGARLEVKAQSPVLLPAARLTRTVVPGGPVRIDSAHPRTVVTYDVTLPSDRPAEGGSPLLVLRLEPDEGAKPGMNRPALLTIGLGSDPLASTHLSGALQIMPIPLPRTCVEPKGCPDSLNLQFDWGGGDPTNVLDQVWSLTSIALAPDASPPALFAFGAESRTVLSTDDQTLTATAAGSFDIGKGKSAFLDGTVTMDTTAIDQGQVPVHGVVQGALTATWTGEGGTAETTVRILIDETAVTGPRGEPLVVVSRLVPLDCQARSRCSTMLPFGASIDSAGAIDAHVEWTLTVVFLPDPPGSLPSNVEWLLETGLHKSP
jgi:hypothetical protein